MNKQPKPHKAPPSPAKRRISPVVRRALTLQVKECLSWAEAAKKAGMSEAGIHKARKHQHVQDLHEQIKAEYVQEVEEMKAPYKAAAIIHGAYLMKNAKSESIQARMVEFFGSDRKQNSVNVQINNTMQAPQGYEYAPPGVEIVTVREADKSA